MMGEPLTVDALMTNLRTVSELVGPHVMPTTILVRPDVYRRLRIAVKRYDGVVLRGSRGSVCVRLRHDRWQVSPI